jgi:O-succinylbenzoic acid--CoA ligase
MNDLLARAAANWPVRPFLRDRKGVMTFAEVENQVGALAETIRRGADQQVVVVPAVDSRSVIELLAVQRAGATAVVLSARWPEALARRLVAKAAADRRPVQTVLFTSGTSSGHPNGVRLSTSNWDAAAAASVASLGHGPGDRWLCPLPLHHAGGLAIVYRCLLAGGEMFLAPDHERLERWIGRVEFASLVPTQLRRLLLPAGTRFDSRARVLVGGGPVDSGVLDQAASAGLVPLPTYGMTETASQLATARPSDPDRRMFPLEGIEVRIGDDERIEVRGPTVFRGYLGEEERRDADWFTTPDRGRVNADGSLTVTGRADRVILTGGEKVDPVEVESAIGTLPGVEEVVVFALGDRDWGEAVAAVYVGSIDPAEIAGRLGAYLPRHALPKHWRRVAALARNELGKIDMVAVIAEFDR